MLLNKFKEDQMISDCFSD